MSVHNVKILELLSIHEVSGFHLLKLRIFATNDQSELYWLIDNETAKSLKEICKFQGVERYRLSLQTAVDPQNGQCSSSVTGTYRDASRKMNFRCSFKFHQQLEKIKNCYRIADLLSYDFIFPNLPKEDTLSVLKNAEEVIEKPIRAIPPQNDEEPNGKETDSAFEDPNAAEIHAEAKEIREINPPREEKETDTSDEKADAKESCVSRNDEDSEIQEGAEELEGQAEGQSENPAVSDEMNDEIRHAVDETASAASIEQKQEAKPKPYTYLLSKLQLKKRIRSIKGFPQSILTASLIVAVVIILCIIIFDILSTSIFNSTENIGASKQQNAEQISETANEKPEIPSLQINDFLTFSIPEGYAALTFNDGPSKYTEAIVDILKEKEVGGTFFFIGYNVQKHPDIVKYVHSNGYTIGSHSMTHDSMTEQTLDEQQYEISESKKIIENITGQPVKFFRPPNGLIDENTQAAAQNEQCQIILWNLDPKDWEAETADEIIKNIKNEPVSAAIITLHESPQLVKALPKIIDYLKEQNLKIVSLQ
ncbi:polysaccharide deacetylase family protein [Ureibacillus sp. FSL K6-8385]|uniref:polysaccharide deacetylase family protein n=1 Tax=Ureibacillus sp. FSL K6-8385 TaxID=2954684 RepID=UPI0031586A31